MSPDWTALETKFPAAAVRALRERFGTPGSFSTTVRDLVRDSGVGERDAEQLLETLAAGSFLAKRTYVHCARCGSEVGGDMSDEQCRECGVAFADEAPVTEVRYQLDRQPPRDVPWVLVLHGMNTRGPWQEELTWLIARSYKRMVPVAIYKYGKIQPGVLFRWRQRMILERVIGKFAALAEQARDAGFDDPPDVIAHSFGTWLIAHALDDSRVRIGRLILLGSIVRPDFDWGRRIADRKVEQVLNHGATEDFWVKCAQLAIPDSGPGGRVGYPAPVRNVAAKGLGHSDYFEPEARMRALFQSVWRPFLSWQSEPPLPDVFEAPVWRPLLLPLRLLTRLIAIGLLAAVAATVAATFAAGIRELLL